MEITLPKLLKKASKQVKAVGVHLKFKWANTRIHKNKLYQTFFVL